jgi:ribonucleoside-diphosphate reductase alpha chain
LSGGTAPGHIPLKKSLTAIRSILDGAQGRQLRPIECHDIICHSADSVYAGGIREAALIALFSIDDGEMMICKTGNWWSTNPQRARANNSVVLLRSNASKEQFLRITKSTRQYGEPGFFFTDDLDYGGNPCMEISLNPRLKITPSTRAEIARWAKASGKVAPKVEVGEVKWGWSFCNLTTVNVAVMQNAGHFLEAVRQASVIGTLQASLTSFPYLGWITEFIVWREALLGVSMTGILDNPSIGLNADLLKQGSQAVVDTNIEWAEKIGINSAARTTCVKPEGSASKVLGVVGHGIHAHHARRYFLRVRCKPNDPAYLYFRSVNPHMCTRESDVKEFITFPVTAPDAAVIRSDLTEEQFLDNVFLVQKNWVAPGTARPDSSPGACNNVSNTCNVRDGMWDHVSNAIWKNRAIMTGISLMPWYGDKEFQNAPQEEVINEADEAKWNHIVSHYKKVEWSAFIERTDNTTLMTESGCAGGACLL